MPRESTPKIIPLSIVEGEGQTNPDYTHLNEQATATVEDLVAQYENDIEGLSGALYKKLWEIADRNDNADRFLAEVLAGELWLVENQIKLSHINSVVETT